MKILGIAVISAVVASTIVTCVPAHAEPTPGSMSLSVASVAAGGTVVVSGMGWGNLPYPSTDPMTVVNFETPAPPPPPITGSIGTGGAPGTNGGTQISSHSFPASAGAWSFDLNIPVTTPPGNGYDVCAMQNDNPGIGDYGCVSLDILPASPASRIAGPDRYATSVAIAQASFPSEAPVVFIATGTNYPDALAAGPAAAHLGGPLLLTDPLTLPAEVTAEIETLKPEKIIIVGGPTAVSDSVQSKLALLAPVVVRLAGSDRFDTGRQVVQYAFSSASSVYIATGLTFPDALSAAAAAGAKGSPVVLVNGPESSLDSATEQLILSLGATSATVVGGANAVSVSLEDSLARTLGTSAKVQRLAGSDRFQTSVLIAKNAFTSSDAAYIATGTAFPDALSGSVLAASKGAPLLTVLPNCVLSETYKELAALGASKVVLLGGPSALSGRVATLSQCS